MIVTLVEILVWILLLGGMFFSVVGGIGLIRLPDVFSRMHGAGMTDTLGAGLILGGLAVHSLAATILFRIAEREQRARVVRDFVSVTGCVSAIDFFAGGIYPKPATQPLPKFDVRGVHWNDGLPQR